MPQPNARLALPLLALLWVGGCAERGALSAALDDEAVPEAERYGGTAVVAIPAEIESLNPLAITRADGNAIAGLVLFTPLVRLGANNDPVAYLARSWSLNADSSLLTFHLRDDVYWHDGVKTTAYDVEFAYERARDPATAYAASDMFEAFGEGMATDSFTFQVELRPHADFLFVWALFVPLPRHLLQDVPPAELARSAYGGAPVGNGPFRFVSRAPGSSWTFEANGRFPEELDGRPYLDRLVFRVIPDATAALTELLTGSVHVMRPEPLAFAQVEGSDAARLVPYSPEGYYFIAWNTRRPPFDDVRLRRAFTLAIDRQAIVDGILHGRATVAHSSVSPTLWQYDPAVGADLGYDPGAARRLLAEAGWADRDGDGVLEDGAGRPLRFTILVSQGGPGSDVVQKVTADLRAIGVAAEQRVLEGNAVIERVGARDFEAAYGGFGTGPTVQDARFFHCRYRDELLQYSGICDPELDRLLDAAPLVVDRDAARPLWTTYQRRLSELQPFTFLFHPQRPIGVGTALRNVQTDAMGDWGGIARWWLRRDETAAN